MKKIIKITTIMLVFAMLMPLALSSCILENGPEEHDLIAEWEKDLADENGVIDFEVRTYCNEPLTSAVHSFPFKVKNGQIYTCYDEEEFLYDSVVYVEEFEFIYTDGLIMGAERYDKANGNVAIKTTMEKMQDHTGYYIISTKDLTGYSSNIIICKLEGIYYFLPLYYEDDTAVVNQLSFIPAKEEKRPVADFFKTLRLSSYVFFRKSWKHDLAAEWERTMKNEDGTVAFNAKTYCATSLDQMIYELPIKVKNGQIYTYNGYEGEDILYTVTYTEDFEFVYDQRRLEYMKRLYREKSGELMKTLERLKNKQGYYILEAKGYNGRGHKVLVCELDGIYYFLYIDIYNRLAAIKYAEALVE